MTDIVLDPMTWIEFQISNEYGGDDDQQGFGYRSVVNAVAGNRYIVDFRTYPEAFKRIRSVWLDNSAGATAATIGTDVMKNISIPTGSQALVTLINSPENKLFITGSGTLNLTATNRDLRPFALGNGAVTVSGNVLVWGAACTVMNTAQVPITAADTLIIAAGATRKALVLSNAGNNAVAIGNAGVTFATGYLMAPGDKLVWDIPVFTGTVHGICAATLTSVISYLETTP